MRIVFDENTPDAIAKAIATLAAREDRFAGRDLEILHARDLTGPRTSDVRLIDLITRNALPPSALITTDKAVNTRQHERTAFRDTGCIGIVLRNKWCHIGMWERAELSVIWFPTWVETIETAPPGSMWQCPYLRKTKRLSARF